MADDNLDILQRHYHDVFESSGWQDFRRYRQSWDDIIRRRSPQILNQTAAQFLQSTNTDVDIQSPDLEKDLHDRVAVCLSSSPKIDAVSLDTRETPKGHIEDVRIWSAGSWLQQDEQYSLRRHVYESMIRYGVAVLRKTWKMPKEPEQNADREKEYEKQAREAFGFKPVSPTELSWFPLRQPEVFVQESIVPYTVARELKNNDGKALRLLRDDNKLVFVGDSESVYEYESNQWSSCYVKVTVDAYLDKQTNRWKVCEWVRGHYASIDESELLDSYECPFEHAPYFVVPSGDEMVTESNPHLRYRPMLYPLLVDVQELNALLTLLVTTTVWHLQNPFYVRLDGLDQQQMHAIEGMEQAGWGVIEGAGAERKFVFRVPEPATGEVMAAPRLEAMPNFNLPEAFVARIEQVQQSILQHRANRYLTGDAMEQTREQPATTTLNQAEAAATPFGTYLANCDMFIKDWLLAEHQAILYWDKASTKDTAKLYPWRVRGDEPAVGKLKDAGDVVEIDASMLETPYVLRVITRNETQAEHAMNQQMADSAYQQQAITKEQWLERRGADDPQQQMEALWEDDLSQDTDALFKPVLMSQFKHLLQALTGLNESLLQPEGGPDGAAPPTGQQAPSQGAQGADSNMARPQMTPPPVPGPQGGAGQGMGGAPV